MLVQYVSQSFNVDINALYLLLAIATAYPLTLIYIALVQPYTKNASIKSLFWAVCGLSLATVNYRFNVIHSLVCIVGAYLTLKLLPIKVALVVNFVGPMVYLMVGYSVTQVDWAYAVTWTMPLCITVLRLIAISFDVYDGQQLRKTVNNNNDNDDKKVQVTNVSNFSIFSILNFSL